MTLNHIIPQMIAESVGRGGSLVDSTPFVRLVAGSNPALAAKCRDVG